jgi:hypothetical protein
MHSDIDAASVAWFHDRQLRQRDWPVVSRACAQGGAWAWIDANHRYNGLLRNEEERARRLDVPPSEIAAGQRLIDRYRQKSRDAVERLDAALGAGLAARQSGDSAGAMIDRLSILALAVHRLRIHAQRHDAGDAHVRACCARLERLRAQRRDLMAGLDALLAAARAGRMPAAGPA